MQGCPEGKSRIAVSMEGYVSRCSADPNYPIFNILELLLKDIRNDTIMFKDFREINYLLTEYKSCDLV